MDNTNLLAESYCTECNKMYDISDICETCGICTYVDIVHNGVCDDCFKDEYYLVKRIYNDN